MTPAVMHVMLAGLAGGAFLRQAVTPRSGMRMTSTTGPSRVQGLVHQLQASGAAPPGFIAVAQGLEGQYATCAKGASTDPDVADQQLATYIKLAIDQVRDPYRFEPLHRSLREPFDYYEFGKSFFEPMVNLEQSVILGEEQLVRITEQLAAGENVIIFSNHQIEPDPTVLSILLDDKYPTLCPHMISVAGDRVTTDPMAAPMSLGRNLLNIFSKRHIENPPELKEQKRAHNQRAMRMLGDLLAQGGQCVWIAPSGGRDRPSADAGGAVVPAPFDEKNIDMFRLLGAQALKHSQRTTHFYPMSMYTYPITPPPDEIGGQVGEVSVDPCRAAARGQRQASERAAPAGLMLARRPAAACPLRRARAGAHLEKGRRRHRRWRARRPRQRGRGLAQGRPAREHHKDDVRRGVRQLRQAAREDAAIDGIALVARSPEPRLALSSTASSPIEVLAILVPLPAFGTWPC